MEIVKRTISYGIWMLVGLMALLVVALRVPAFQTFMGGKVANVLSEQLDTKVSVGRVDVSPTGRIVIDDVHIADQSGRPMIDASRLAAKVNLLPLLRGKVVVSSAQLFGVQGTFSKASAEARPNYQFLIDALSSDDNSEKKPLDLQIGSVVVRHAGFTYDRIDVPRTGDGRFSPHHLNVSDVSMHLLLPELTDSTLRASLKRASLKEASGLELKDLSLKVNADRRHLLVSNLNAALPHSRLSADTISVNYRMEGDMPAKNSLRWEARLKPSSVTPDDLAPLLPELADWHESVQLHATLSGTNNQLTARIIDVEMGDDIQLLTMGYVARDGRWSADIERLNVSEQIIAKADQALKQNGKELPEILKRPGDISFSGRAGGAKGLLSVNGKAITDAGNADVNMKMSNGYMEGTLKTDGIRLGRLLDNNELDVMVADVAMNGTTDMKHLAAKGLVARLDYKGYSYHDISIDGTLDNDIVEGRATVDDPNIAVEVEGRAETGRRLHANVMAQVKRLVPQALGLTNRYGDASFSGTVQADVTGNTLSSMTGEAHVSQFDMKGSKADYHLDRLDIAARQSAQGRTLTMNGDFADAKLATGKTGDTATATIYKSDWLNTFLGLPIDINRPVHLTADRNEREGTLNVKADMPEMAIAGILMDYNVEVSKSGKDISSAITWNSLSGKPFSGTLNATTELLKNHGRQIVHARIHDSDIIVDDTTWHIHPSDIVYADKRLTVDYFSIDNHNQHLTIYGTAGNSAADSMMVDLKAIDVEYVLNLVNFHVVEFQGLATGKACATGILGKNPATVADIVVDDFRFQHGRMGTLHAHANYDHNTKQININAHADDEQGDLRINGYVSPARNYMALDLLANNTRLEFVGDFCSSFMRNVDLYGNGHVKLAGHLSGANSINMEGLMHANGSLCIIPLNTTYTIHDQRIRMIPNEIYLEHDTVTDREQHRGIVDGAIHHKEFTRLTFDIDVKADTLLAYDMKEYGDNTFFGTVYATGNCAIRGRQGRIDFNADFTPEKGSFIEYDAASPESIDKQEFITWRDVTEVTADGAENENSSITASPTASQGSTLRALDTDIYLNLLANTDPEKFTLRLLTDKETGDNISLCGSGTLRASYYNKGAFDMFGTYLVNHGNYKITIQNIVKRDFHFQNGSTIVFGGDPFNAALHLKAIYTVNSVSLASLQTGTTIKNNVRADCVMNITGTPGAPHVDFDIDFPTLSADNRQMVKTLINSQEELNQQAISLLAIGQFYNQRNNAGIEQQNQTSLAMQSILSGTVSQQISHVLSSLTNKTNWSLGANISTGDEGWSNAEYEGLLEGRLLNNRLLINGQFGYRDNATTTGSSSFIGDFDIRYLLTPRGGAALRVYNQTNDRYFTRNALNTQGAGFILKKDFDSPRYFFKKKKTDDE